jgi:hypothetical protein
MDATEKEELKEGISSIIEGAAISQVNTRGGYVDLRRLEQYLLEFIDDV